MQSGQFKLPGKKKLQEGVSFGVIVVDVAEMPIERPKKKQRAYYSGKKKRHTLKAQVLIKHKTLQIVCVAIGKGRQHNFKVYKRSKVKPHLASKRIFIEHIFRRLKVFRILKDTYRHRRKRFALRLHLIAALYNFDLLSKSH